MKLSKWFKDWLDAVLEERLVPVDCGGALTGVVMISTGQDNKVLAVFVLVISLRDGLRSLSMMRWGWSLGLSVGEGSKMEANH